MRRSSSKRDNSSENPFSFSIGDLMAGVLFIFVLLLASTMLEIQEKAEADAEIASRYNGIKVNLHHELDEEFKNELDKWNAAIDPTELAVRFTTNETTNSQESDIKVSYFRTDRTEPSPEFLRILDEFFPKFLDIVSNPKFIDSIEEIRIEGHTDSDGSYMHNIELSQGRARNVLDYCLKIAERDSIKHNQIEEIRNKITANGLSYSHPILNEDGTENKNKSRRVEFKIRTNAEEQLEEIAKIRLK